MSSPSVALVGNAPTGGAHRAAIDACDHVVRFNDARDFGAGAGSRIDDLFLVNRGGAPAEWLDDPALADRPAVAAARRIVLPLHPESAFLDTRRDAHGRIHVDDTDHGAALTAALGSRERPVVALGADDHERCCRRLRLVPGTGSARSARSAWPAWPDAPAPPDAAVQRPSTGFVALSWYLDTLPPDADVRLYGFTFDGWPGHPWARERAWVERASREGRLTIVPVE